jgi:hypothetical protein
VYGAHRRIDRDARPIADLRYQPITGDPFSALLQGNLIGMHGTVLYRREALVAGGGFDESLRLCEDYDVYLRLSRRHAVASHPDETALYRWHGTNMSTDVSLMLRNVLAVHRRHRPARSEGAPLGRAWRMGRANFRTYYAGEVLGTAGRSPVERLGAVLTAARLAPTTMARLLLRAALTRIGGLTSTRRKRR